MTQVLKLNFLYLSTGQDPESLRDVLLRHIVAGKAVRFRLESFDCPLQKLSKMEGEDRCGFWEPRHSRRWQHWHVAQSRRYLQVLKNTPGNGLIISVFKLTFPQRERDGEKWFRDSSSQTVWHPNLGWCHPCYRHCDMRTIEYMKFATLEIRYCNCDLKILHQH